jgi:hypothetical protein
MFVIVIVTSECTEKKLVCVLLCCVSELALVLSCIVFTFDLT